MSGASDSRPLGDGRQSGHGPAESDRQEPGRCRNALHRFLPLDWTCPVQLLHASWSLGLTTEGQGIFERDTGEPSVLRVPWCRAALPFKSLRLRCLRMMLRDGESSFGRARSLGGASRLVRLARSHLCEADKTCRRRLVGGPVRSCRDGRARGPNRRPSGWRIGTVIDETSTSCRVAGTLRRAA